MQSFNGNGLESGAAWWLEIATDEPYLYLFGPFESAEEAEATVGKYEADLAAEGWQLLSSKVTRKGPSEVVLVA
jgi:hypothetical protein